MTLAIPAPLVVEEAAEGFAPPVPTQLTVAPLTGLAPASVTRTLSWHSDLASAIEETVRG